MKTRIYIQTIITSTVFFGLTSCSVIVQGLYGVKGFETVDEKIILRYWGMCNIPISDSYELDTA